MSKQAVALAEFREQSLAPIMDRLRDALAGEMPVEQMMQTIMVSIEKTPKLLQANRQSVVASAMTACLLRLPVDGATGQGYLIPFKGHCQFIPGYKGLITLAGRSTFSLHNDIVRELDEFDMRSGSDPVIHHKPDPRLNDKQRGKAIGAYAIWRSRHLPTIMQWMPISDIMAIRDSSAGFKMNPQRSVWTSDPKAMVLKTPIRIGSKKVPHEIGFQDIHRATALEEQHDLGGVAHLDEEGVVHTTFVDNVTENGDVQPQELEERIEQVQVMTHVLVAPDGAHVDCDGLSAWANQFIALWQQCDGVTRQAMNDRNLTMLSQLPQLDAAIWERLVKETGIE